MNYALSMLVGVVALLGWFLAAMTRAPSTPRRSAEPCC